MMAEKLRLNLRVSDIDNVRIYLELYNMTVISSLMPRRIEFFMSLRA